MLGPLLFLIHINDLQNNISLRLLNLTDDTLLYTTFKQSTYLQDSANLNVELKTISNWLIANRLTLNVNQRRCMLLHSINNCLLKNISFIIKID